MDDKQKTTLEAAIEQANRITRTEIRAKNTLVQLSNLLRWLEDGGDHETYIKKSRQIIDQYFQDKQDAPLIKIKIES